LRYLAHTSDAAVKLHSVAKTRNGPNPTFGLLALAASLRIKDVTSQNLGRKPNAIPLLHCIAGAVWPSVELSIGVIKSPTQTVIPSLENVSESTSAITPAQTMSVPRARTHVNGEAVTKLRRSLTVALDERQRLRGTGIPSFRMNVNHFTTSALSGLQ